MKLLNLLIIYIIILYQWKLLFGLFSSAFAGIFFTLFIFAFTEGKSVLLPYQFDVPFSSIIFLMSSLSLCCTGFFLQSDAFGKKFCDISKKISLYFSVIIFVYWIIALFMINPRGYLRFTWICYVPILFHFIFHYANKILSKQVQLVKEKEVSSV